MAKIDWVWLILLGFIMTSLTIVLVVATALATVSLGAPQHHNSHANDYSGAGAVAEAQEAVIARKHRKNDLKALHRAIATQEQENQAAVKQAAIDQARQISQLSSVAESHAQKDAQAQIKFAADAAAKKKAHSGKNLETQLGEVEARNPDLKQVSYENVNVNENAVDVDPVHSPVPTPAPYHAVPTSAPFHAVPTPAPFHAVPTPAPYHAVPTQAPYQAPPVTISEVSAPHAPFLPNVAPVSPPPQHYAVQPDVYGHNYLIPQPYHVGHDRANYIY